MKNTVYYIILLLGFNSQALMAQLKFGPEIAYNKVKEMFDSDSSFYFFDISGKLIMEKHKQDFIVEKSDWVIRYQYDSEGNLISEYSETYYSGPDTIYSDSSIRTYIYQDGKLSREVLDDFSLQTVIDTTDYYCYDAQGNMIEHIQIQGQTISKEIYRYNISNLVDTFFLYDNIGFEWGVGSVNLDTLHLRKTLVYRYDKQNRIISEAPSSSLTSQLIYDQSIRNYLYDANGNLSKIHECLGQIGNCSVDNFVTYENTYYKYRNQQLVKIVTEQVVDNKVINRNKEKFKYNKNGLLKKNVTIDYKQFSNWWLPIEYRSKLKYNYTYYF